MATVSQNHLQVLQKCLRKATEQSTVIINGRSQNCFKSCFKIRQHEKAGDPVWQWWINPFAWPMMRLNTTLLSLSTQGQEVEISAHWHSCARSASPEQGWWAQPAPEGWQELLWGFRALCCLFQHSSPPLPSPPPPPPLCSPVVFK